MNPMMLLQFKNSWDTFQRKHPKFPMFLKKVSTDAITEGSIIDIKVTTPDGTEYASNLKVTDTDMQLIAQLKQMAQNQ